jgi:hypothetical protein
MMTIKTTVALALALGAFSSIAWSQAKKPAAPPAANKTAAANTASQISAVAFSPDGSKIAAGGYKVVTLFDTASGKALAKLEGNPGPITSLVFSPDGKTLAVASGLPGKTGEVRLWDVSFVKSQGLWAVKQVPIVLSGPSDVVYSVAISPDGKRVAAASYDHDVTVWTLPAQPASKSKIENPKSKILKDHTDAVYAVAFAPDSRTLASAAGDRTVKVWDVVTGKRLYTLSESTAELYAVAFRPDGKQIAAGGVDKTLRTWNVTPTGGTLAKSAFAHQGAILRVAYTNGGASLVTSSEDLFVKRWDTATLAEQKIYPKQPDWPAGMAVSPNGKLVAVGTHNGAMTIYDSLSGKLVHQPLMGQQVASASKMAPPTSSSIPGRRLGDQKARRPPGNSGATLFQASLGSISPLGAPRGGTVRFTLAGGLLNDATGVYFDDPAITAKIVEPKDPNSGLLRVDANLGPQARIGVHRCYVQTPHGTTGALTFAVGGWPEVMQAEPNNTLETAQKISSPCTVVGALDTPGDVDSYRIEARAGEELVFEVVAQPIRSRLQPVLALMDASGKTLAESKTQFGRADTLLGYHFDKAGSYVVQLRDFEGAGGGDVHYRLNVGEFPVVTDVFPLGVQKGAAAEVRIKGFNLGGATTARVTGPAEGGWGRFSSVQVSTPNGPVLLTRLLAVGEDPEVARQSGNTSLAKAQSVPSPATINGTLWENKTDNSALSHYYRFSAKKGQPLVVDVQARRLGSPLDSEIEILDSKGRRVERAVLRAVGQTEVTLSDRDSASTGIRLFAWDGFNVNDYFLVGREVIKLLTLPKGPDDDVQFRGYRGQRLGYLGTTPEFHSIGGAIYKVEIHPPGSTFSSNGYPLTHVYYDNDDGGPLFGKDSHLDFTAPEDGEYIVRIGDTRGQQGEDYNYRLLIHPPRPDFKIIMSPEHPNMPKGGAVTVNVECERYDGFDGPIEVAVEGLPAGITATGTTIEAGENSATLLLTAGPEVKTPAAQSGASIRVVGRARIGGQTVARAIEPDNGNRLVTVLPDPDIRVATDKIEVILRPGEETVVEAQVDRQGKFGGRVPIDVKNLPFGVRVQNIGLNGVLVTEKDTSREFTLYCEPWVKPQSRAFYVIGQVEGGTPNAAAPLMLKIEPKRSPEAETAKKTVRISGK